MFDDAEMWNDFMAMKLIT